MRKTYVVPYDVFEIEDYDAEFYVLMRLGLAADVTFLCTANPSSIAKLCEFAQEHADDLIRDVRDGTPEGRPRAVARRRARSSRSAAGPSRSARARWSRCARRRDGQAPARRLLAGPRADRLLEGRHGRQRTSSASASGSIPTASAPKPVRDWGYLSSEARGSIPLSDEGSGGVLDRRHERLRVRRGRPGRGATRTSPQRWNFLGAHEVDSPRDYYVFLTTTGGLYRYDINDIVRVEGFHNEAPSSPSSARAAG